MGVHGEEAEGFAGVVDGGGHDPEDTDRPRSVGPMRCRGAIRAAAVVVVGLLTTVVVGPVAAPIGRFVGVAGAATAAGALDWERCGPGLRVQPARRSRGVLRPRRGPGVGRADPGPGAPAGAAGGHAGGELRRARRRHDRDPAPRDRPVPRRDPGPLRHRGLRPTGHRGTRAIDCIDDETTDTLVPEDPTPDDPAELERFYAGTNTAVDLDAACIAQSGDWLAAVGTRNVARDLDRIRIALGERRIDFLGYSYGTVLGAVYAQEFPDRIRTMVLDGAVNLTDSSRDEQVANAAGFEGALDKFLAWCADASTCTFGDGDPAAALAGVARPVRAGPRAPGERRAPGRRRRVLPSAALVALRPGRRLARARARAPERVPRRRHHPPAPHRLLPRSRRPGPLQRTAGGHRTDPLRRRAHAGRAVRRVPRECSSSSGTPTRSSAGSSAQPGLRPSPARTARPGTAR